jgi:hypothetical protein
VLSSGAKEKFLEEELRLVSPQVGITTSLLKVIFNGR